MIPKPSPHIDLAALEREILALVRDRLLDLPDELTITSPLADAGLDSMAVMQLLLLIEDRFGIWLPESDLLPENLGSARTLAQVLARRLEERGGG